MQKSYHKFIAGIVYKYVARVNNSGGNEQVMLPRYRILPVAIMFLQCANVNYDWSYVKPHPINNIIPEHSNSKRTGQKRS